QRYSGLTVPSTPAASSVSVSSPPARTRSDPALDRAANSATAPPTAVADHASIGSVWRAAVRPERALPIVMIAWFAGVTLLSLRLFTGLLWTRRMRTHGVVPAEV